MTENKMREWLESAAGASYQNYIGGKWVDAANGETRVLYESGLPDHILGHFPDSTEEDVESALKEANAAFPSWSKTSLQERAMILYRFSDLLLKHQEELAYIISAEQGKVLAESRGEVGRAAVEAKFAAGEVFRAGGSTVPAEGTTTQAQVDRKPIGVIVAISPWNFPVVTPVRKVAPALAYGCTVVMKPASATPWASVKIMELFIEAGVPKGVVNLIVGSGSKTGDALVTNPYVRGISFTGSTALGKEINKQAAGNLTKTQLELGGKNPAVVLNYRDLKAAAQQITSAAFTTSGQRCTSISRVIVLKEHAPLLKEEIVKAMRNLTLGEAWKEGANVGPLINKAHYETVNHYVQKGKEEGATIEEQSGKVPEHSKAYFIAPTLFTDVHPDMVIAQEEIFGPVLVFLEAENIEEAAQLANDSIYGLAASVFSDDLEEAFEMKELIQAGMIHINHGTASQPHVPFGGKKSSGFGAFSIGSSNQDFYTEIQSTYIKYK